MCLLIKDQTLEKENLPTKEFKIENKKSGILKYGAPTSGLSEVLQYNNHVLEYDGVKKVPKVSPMEIFLKGVSIVEN